jgi:hypothetical protein
MAVTGCVRVKNSVASRVLDIWATPDRVVRDLRQRVSGTRTNV